MNYEEEKQLRIDDPTRTYTIETVWDDSTRAISWPYSEEEADELMNGLIPQVGSYVQDRGATLLQLQMVNSGIVIDYWEY